MWEEKRRSLAVVRSTILWWDRNARTVGVRLYIFRYIGLYDAWRHGYED